MPIIAVMTDEATPPADEPALIEAPAAAAAAARGDESAGAAYQVLARKYRPSTFAELIGQDALVRTLTNAIAAGRLAHAFILTGVRGVGKTTTARIIARAVNCVGPDGTGGPTPAPCGACDPCRSIAADRHVDVLELDAASHTGIGDVREIIDAVRYAPVSARYKVYIIDEVHMLSQQAFNGLLKTLEEPPPHTKFIFATTEIRKVPVTVLSRCQRFDLRRVDQDLLVRHYDGIAAREGVAVEPQAMAMIARAADGSVRDGLSLLDQAMAEAPVEDGAPRVTAGLVQEMLGLADRAVVIDLFEAAVTGEAKRALDILGDLRKAGADPLATLHDLMGFTHFLTRLRMVPELAEDPGLPETERVRGGALAHKLPVPVLSRAWQLLLKAVGEVQSAPMPDAALEMALIRLIHSAGLPTPGEAIRRLEAGDYGDIAAEPASAGPSVSPPADPGASAPPPTSAGEMPPPTAQEARPPATGGVSPPASAASGGPANESRAAPAAPPPPGAAVPETEPGADEATAAPAAAMPADFEALARLMEARAEPALWSNFLLYVHPVRYAPGQLEFRPAPYAPATLAADLIKALQGWTGARWMVSLSQEPGEPTLQERRDAAEAARLSEAAASPVVQAVLAAFPGAKIERVHDLAAEAAADSLAAAADPAAADGAGSPADDEDAIRTDFDGDAAGDPDGADEHGEED
jgi:DNA polymerase-3 subunit gamma/tau